MTIRNILLLISITTLTACSPPEEQSTYAYQHYKEQYIQFEKVVTECRDKRQTILSDSTIDILKALPQESIEGFGHVINLADRKCMANTYRDFMESLLLAEVENYKNGNDDIENELLTLKKIQFMDLYLPAKRKFEQLPTDTQKALLSIQEMQEPFDGLNALERAWPKIYDVE
jgi:hypothetical protein